MLRSLSILLRQRRRCRWPDLSLVLPTRRCPCPTAAVIRPHATTPKPSQAPDTTVPSWAVVDPPFTTPPNNASIVNEEIPLTLQYDLIHLLSRVSKQDVIIHECDDFIALNKPPDLRLDGKQHKATVHKLLLYWYPPRSVLNDFHNHHQALIRDVEDCSDQGMVDKGRQAFPLQRDNHSDNIKKPLAAQEDAAIFAKFIQERYHHWRSNSHADSEDHDDPNVLRPCHQLDYNTSGVLLLARNARAARWVQRAMERQPGGTRHDGCAMRRVEKAYVAMVHGKIDTMLMPPRVLQQSQERQDRFVLRQRRLGKVVVIPWAGHPHQASSLSQLSIREQLHTTWGEVEGQFRKGRWSRPKQERENFDNTPTTEGGHHPQDGDADDNDRKMKSRPLPLVFCLSPEMDGETGPNNGSNEEEGDNPTTFFVCAAIASLPNQFPVLLDANETKSMLKPSSHLVATSRTAQRRVRRSKKTQQRDLIFRPSLTEFTVLDYDKRKDVTKLLLRPWSGRRHQLRIHMSLLGHAVVGDPTYRRRKRTTKQQQETRSRRLYLHAETLQLHFGDNDDSDGTEKDDQKENPDRPRPLNLHAPSPF